MSSYAEGTACTTWGGRQNKNDKVPLAFSASSFREQLSSIDFRARPLPRRLLSRTKSTVGKRRAESQATSCCPVSPPFWHKLQTICKLCGAPRHNARTAC